MSATETIPTPKENSALTGPSHTGDMKCPICGAWGADKWINAGGVGIVQWVRVCSPCEQNFRQPNKK